MICGVQHSSKAIRVQCSSGAGCRAAPRSSGCRGTPPASCLCAEQRWQCRSCVCPLGDPPLPPLTQHRVENLYFSYLFMLRAAIKAAPVLAAADYHTGNAAEDARTAELMRRLVHSESLLRTSCPIPFDEGRLWKGDDGGQLRAQLQVGGGAGSREGGRAVVAVVVRGAGWLAPGLRQLAGSCSCAGATSH